MWTPNPAVLLGVAPVAVVIKIFGAHDILVEVLAIGAEALCELAFAFVDPLVECVRRSGGEQIPIAGVRSGHDEFRRASIAQRESGSV